MTKPSEKAMKTPEQYGHEAVHLEGKNAVTYGQLISLFRQAQAEAYATGQVVMRAAAMECIVPSGDRLSIGELPIQPLPESQPTQDSCLACGSVDGHSGLQCPTLSVTCQPTRDKGE